jgi:hypothetical protein
MNTNISLKELTLWAGAFLAIMAMLAIVFTGIGAVLLVLIDAAAKTHYFNLVNAFLVGIGFVAIISAIFWGKQQRIIGRTAKCWNEKDVVMVKQDEYKEA